MPLTLCPRRAKFLPLMKCLLAISAGAALGLTACDSMNSPITGGNFDPLGTPGSTSQVAVVAPTFKGGQFVHAAMPNTGFYRSKPKGNANADKLLTQGTSMKYIAASGSYSKVELDSGDVGFVPTVMLEDPATVPTAPTGPAIRPGQYQVYPPVPGPGDQLPQIDPSGLPPADSNPAVIDPTAPPVTTPIPIPAVTPNTGTFPTPTPSVEPEKVPLPPAAE